MFSRKKDPLQIIPFLTYGTYTNLSLKGRALEDEDIDLSNKGWFNLLLNSWRRFASDEIKHTPLKIILPNSEEIISKTDSEGYYLSNPTTVIDITKYVNKEGWLSYKASYIDTDISRKIQLQNCFSGEMLVPKTNSDFGVISDIDDTILHTGVASRLKWKVIVNTLFKTPQKRKALEGSAEFYNLLKKGSTSEKTNPIFYVSNSPWNLYRYLDFFLKTNDFPKGPILLRDFRKPFDRTRKVELAHKYHEIHTILNTYPTLNFILIGDCGEKDAYIYLDVVKAFPNRISAIYLRTVEHNRRMRRISKLFENYTEVPVLIVDKSIDAIAHAKTLGFVI